MSCMMVLREVHLTGMDEIKTQYKFNLRAKSKSRQVCLAVEAVPFCVISILCYY